MLVPLFVVPGSQRLLPYSYHISPGVGAFAGLGVVFMDDHGTYTRSIVVYRHQGYLMVVSPLQPQRQTIAHGCRLRLR